MEDQTTKQELEIRQEPALPTVDTVQSADDVRRKLIKAGAIGMPLAISLHSGTAWAISSCADNYVLPSSESALDNSLTDSNNLSYIEDVTGIKKSVVKGKKSQDGIVDNPANNSFPGGPFPTSGTVDSGEVLWLLVNGGASCWVSYCDNVVNGSPGMVITGLAAGDVCSSDGGDSDKGDSGKKDSDKK